MAIFVNKRLTYSAECGSLVLGSTVGYPSDSLASCCFAVVTVLCHLLVTEE